MKQNLSKRSFIIAIVVGFLGWHAYNGIARDKLELGIDLQGGSEIQGKFDLSEEAPSARGAILAQSIRIIQDRIDRFGLKEIVIQPLGDDRFALQVSARDKTNVDTIKELVSVLGNLEFRITVEAGEPTYEHYKTKFEAALKEGGDIQRARTIEPAQRAEEDLNAGRYPHGLKWYKLSDRAIGRFGEGRHVQNWVLCRLDTDNVNGRDLVNVAHRPDTSDSGLRGGWVVTFDVRKFAQSRMANLTAKKGDHMAIILNDRVDSAPVLESTLSATGQISGGFPEEEARTLAAVLQSGALEHKPEIVAESTISSDLAGGARRTGVLSTLVAFVLVLLIMIAYYRGPGMVANFALLLNLVLLVGVLTWFGAVLTLPGIAGVVLTVGMAVDANILVFERIKEERTKGRTVAQSIAAGYDRALVTIVDSNLTTLITAYFLFQIGSGPVRGFGITLAIGIIISMFTALYVTRTIFLWALKRGTIKEFRLGGEFRVPAFPWMSYLRTSASISIVGVIAGIVIFLIVPDKRKYDLEFTQGSKLVLRFHESVALDAVKGRLERLAAGNPRYNDFSVRVSAEGIGAAVAESSGNGFELRSQDVATKAEIDQLVADLRALFSDWLLPGPFRATLAAAPPNSGALSTGMIYFTSPGVQPAQLRTALDRYAAAHDGRLAGTRVEKLEAPPGAATAFRLLFANEPVEVGGDIAIHLRQALRAYDHAAAIAAIRAESTDQSKTAAQQAEARAQLALLEATPVTDTTVLFNEADPFPLADRIDPFTAEMHRSDAIRAIFFSIAGIIAYVAFRFRAWNFGFASVIAIVHDVIVTLGVATLFSWLGLVDARLNLVTVAAYLTLIGYSINDTIVVFDRIRENRGSRSRARLGEIIDRSVNQTLSRSIRTSLTVLVVVAVLLVMNHGVNAPLEGFAFILTFGALVGVYSTIFIASPLLLFLPWMWQRCGASLKGLAKRLGIFAAASAAVLLGLDFARGAFTGLSDVSRPILNDLILGVPVGLGVLFLFDFIPWLRLEERQREIGSP
ncbi:MAG: protein translocase subunit SecD [Planctomycetaceae bacterium]